ncbi:MAG TPA: hypothetical protein VMY36_00470 [Patescibacteria group bacterium]|nr:hypothetical protein [Patescibacteria group bacterium]
MAKAKFKKFKLPKTGDFLAYKVEVWAKEVLQFSFIGKLTGTELKISKDKGYVKTDTEALKKLRIYSVKKAREIYQGNRFRIGEEFQAFYFPSW